MKDAETKMQTGKLSYYSAIDFVMNKANVKTIGDYLETSYKFNNTVLNIKYYRNYLKYFKMHLRIQGATVWLRRKGWTKQTYCRVWLTLFI